MEYQEHLASIRRDADVVLALADGHLDVAVPSCPGWTVADLVRHLGILQWWGAQAVGQREIQPVQRRDAPPPPPDPELVTWLRGRAEAFLAALEEAGADKSCWTFAGSGTAAFWARRQANELSVHRWDLELAFTGAPAAIDAPLAADGIDEYVTVFAGVRGVPADRDAATLHLHCTDVDGEWLVRLADGRASITREHAKGDVAVRGTASDLVLTLWRRLPLDRVEVFGDRGLLEAFVEHIAV